MVTTSPTSKAALEREPTYLVSSDATTGETLGRVAMTPPEEVESVAAEVAVARRAWAGTPLRERGRVVAEAAQVLLRRSDELATSGHARDGQAADGVVCHRRRSVGDGPRLDRQARAKDPRP